MNERSSFLNGIEWGHHTIARVRTSTEHASLAFRTKLSAAPGVYQWRKGRDRPSSNLTLIAPFCTRLSRSISCKGISERSIRREQAKATVRQTSQGLPPCCETAFVLDKEQTATIQYTYHAANRTKAGKFASPDPADSISIKGHHRLCSWSGNPETPSRSSAENTYSARATGARRMSLDRRFKAVCIAMTFAFLTGIQNRSQAEESILVTIGPRVGFSTTSTPLLGKQEKENFRLYDVAALIRLPWHSLLGNSSWKVETRLITSLGAIEGGGDAGLIATFVPDLALSGWNGLISLDAGLGIGLFSRSKFGQQDFGGLAQVVGTVGMTLTPFAHGYTGLRLQHFSDAGLYGSDALGVDMFLLEIGYKF